MYLLPKPHHIKETDNVCSLPGCIDVCLCGNADEAFMVPVNQLRKSLKRGLGITTKVVSGSDADRMCIRLQLNLRYAAQEYALYIQSQSVLIEGGGDAGVYYGIQTLRQIIAQNISQLPCVEIHDCPDYAVRGYYLDVSRGKVPKLRTLKRFIEKLAHYKINHFQLYFEHTYAFKSHPEIWAGSDALSYDDIVALDDVCRRHHIEFIPSLNTFGHCYRIVCNQRNQHLNEFKINAVEKPFSYRDALCHYTLDCTNPETLVLIDDLIGEMAPAFRSKQFNICCDETFDLGKGRNKDAVEREGAGALYLGHLLEVIKTAEKHGKHALFWGDIILRHPELLSELPRDVTVMHWDYSSDIRRENCRTLARSGLPFYVCSSVHGWRKWMHDLNMATLNISRMARCGYENGAVGFVNTDWGDAGTVNALTNSYHGMILGASCAWNVRAFSDNDCGEFDTAFSVLEFADDSKCLVSILRDISTYQRVTWHDVLIWLDPADDMPSEWFDPETGFPSVILNISPTEYVEADIRLRKAKEQLSECCEKMTKGRKHHQDDLLLGIQGSHLMLKIGIIMKGIKQPDAKLPAVKPGDVADEIRWFERLFSNRWHRVNRPSEYYRLKTLLLLIAEQLDKIAMEGA